MEIAMTWQAPGIVVAGILAASLAMMGLCAAAILPWMVLAARRRTTRTRRSAYERCGRQLTLASCLCGVGVVAAAGLCLLAPMPPTHAIYRPLIVGLSGLALCGGAASILMRLRAQHAVWLTVSAVLAGLCNGGLLLGALAMHVPALFALGVRFSASGSASSLSSELASTLPSTSSFGLSVSSVPSAQLPLSCLADLAQRVLDAAAARPDLVLFPVLIMLGLGLAGAGGLALLVLIVRRSRDDYGRDYYRLAASWCVRWGVCGLVLLLGVSCAGWYLYMLPFMPVASEAAVLGAASVIGIAPVWLWIGGSELLLCLALASWGGVAASEHPMRHKSLMLLGLAAVYSWLAVSLWVLRIL